jgi:hypothetical protein
VRGLIVLGLLLCAGAARATEIDVSLDGPVPFTEEELRDAVGMRLLEDDLHDRLAISVRAGPKGAVLVYRDGQLRSIDLGQRVGASAARLVALEIVDLVLAPAEPAPLPAPPDVSQNRLVLSVFGGLGKGSDDRDPLGGCVGVDVTGRFGRRLRLALAAAWFPPATRDPGEFSETTVQLGILRASAGVGLGPVDVLGGPVLAVYHAATQVNDGNTILAGVGVGVRARFPIFREFSAYAGADLDVFFNRLEISDVFGGDSFQSPPVAFTASLGLSYELRP